MIRRTIVSLPLETAIAGVTEVLDRRELGAHSALNQLERERARLEGQLEVIAEVRQAMGQREVLAALVDRSAERQVATPQPAEAPDATIEPTAAACSSSPSSAAAGPRARSSESREEKARARREAFAAIESSLDNLRRWVSP